MFGELDDLPAAPGAVDLPAPAKPRAVAPIAPSAPTATANVDLPAPAKPRAPAAPTAQPLVDLPAPASAKTAGGVDLPAPAKPRAPVATAPAAPPASPAKPAADLPSLARPRPPAAPPPGVTDLPAAAKPRAPAPMADLPAVASPKPAGLVDLPATARSRAPTPAPAPAPAVTDLPATARAKIGAQTVPATPRGKPGGALGVPIGVPVALPEPVGMDELDLPSPARSGPGHADLPAPASARGGVDLPSLARARPGADLPSVARGTRDLDLDSDTDSELDLPTPAARVDLPSVAHPDQFPTPAAPIDLDALDELPSVATPKAPPSSDLDLDDPFARGLSDDEFAPTPAPTARALGTPSTGLPTPKRPDGLTDLPASSRSVDLPAAAPRGTLGRVVLERRAVPASTLTDIGLPAPATGIALPSVSSGISLPTPVTAGLPSVGGAGLPSAAVAGLPTPSGAGLPTPSGAGLPTPAMAGLPTPSTAGLPAALPGASLPTPAHRALDLPSPAAPRGGDDAFGELDLPLGDEPAHAGPPSIGTDFDLPLPPPGPAPTQGASDLDRGAGRARGRAGGVGFGELSLEDDGLPRPASPPADVDEFDQIPLEPAKGDRAPSAAAMPDIGLDTAIPPRETELRRERREPSTASASTTKGPARRTGLYATLGIVGTLVVGGAALSLTSAGPFGANLIDESLNGPKRHAAAARIIESAQTAMAHDTFGRARRALRELDDQLQQTPNEHELLAFATFANYMTLARFGTDSTVGGRARGLYDRLGTLPANTRYLAAARAARELVNGHADAARRGAGSEPAAKDLITLALLDGNDAAAALEAARATNERRPTARSRFLYARALYQADDRAGAQREAEGILASEPEHAGARLLIAHVQSERTDGRERALSLAREVEAMTAAASVEERTEAAVLIGQVELGREHLTAARQAFERALVLDPRSPGALNGAGTIFYKQGNYTDALARFQAAQTADPSDVDARLGIAMASLSLDRAGDARTQLEPLLTDHGDDPRVHYWLAKAMNAMNDQTLAEREFREAIRLDSSNLDAYTTLASMLFGLQRPAAAEQVLEQARAHVSDQAAIHRAMGEGRLARSDAAGAEPELRQAVSAHPDDIRAHFLLERALRSLHRYDEAQREIDAVARLDPEYPDLLVERGRLAEDRGDAAGALATFRAALSRDPQNPDLIVRVGHALVASGQYADADAQLSNFITDHPNVAEAQYVLGRARLALGNSADAVRLLERATELDATRADFRAYAARANLERGQIQRAVEHANQAVNLDPHYALGYAVRGDVEVRAGQAQNAITDANRALQLDPNLAEADATWADAAEALGHPAEAIAAYQRAVGLAPTHGEWWARLGRILADQGHAPQAQTAYERATGLGDPVNPPPPWLAPAHRDLGDLVRGRDAASARRHYQRFLELSPANAAGVSEVRQAIDELGQ